MPTRSFDTIRPGLDYAFLLSLFRIKQNLPFVVVHTLIARGIWQKVHLRITTVWGRVLCPTRWSKILITWHADTNEREGGRRFTHAVCRHIARHFGKDPGAGYIDFSVGGTIRYIPIQDVIGWLAEGNVDELKRRFEGRVVLIGSVTRLAGPLESSGGAVRLGSRMTIVA